jgi:hypothetical protein
MSSVLHPVGPEPATTYWARRAAVLLALVVGVGLVIALVLSSNNRSSVLADPAPPVGAPPATSPGTSATPDTSTSPSAAASPAPDAPSPRSAGTSKSSSSKPAATSPAACEPKQLRATLTGKQRLRPKQKSTVRLSLINGSDQTCVVSVSRKNFELEIYSGTDRIWSSDDCSSAVKPISTEVRAEDAVEWTMSWNGRRSREGCRTRSEVPQPGTYVATAQLAGAEPVQLRMILGG